MGADPRLGRGKLGTGQGEAMAQTREEADIVGRAKVGGLVWGDSPMGNGGRVVPV